MKYNIASLASELSYLQIIAIGLVAVLLYRTVCLTYSLTLGPLAKIPGPRLAAATRWVETYHECFNIQGGRFPWAYREWHDTYGTIVRLAPNEVHIRDSQFFNELYSTKPQHKTERLWNRFGTGSSLFDTTNHSLHARRRTALEGFFSRKRISERIGDMQQQLDRLCDIIHKEYVGTGKIIDTENMWSCWASDVISAYCFATSDNMIALPDFASPLRSAMSGLLEPVHYISQFPILKYVLFGLPEWFVVAVYPTAGAIIALKSAVLKQIKNIRARVNSSPEADHEATIFGAIMKSDLPSAESSDLRLKDEGLGFVAAGTETTMRTLSVALYFLWERPETRQKLKTELKDAIPDPNQIPHWEQLSKLPYLAACISEALRLSYGASQRLIRVFDQPIYYAGFKIPPGVEISMDIYDVCHDENVFPNSFQFQPERWLSEGTNASSPLSHYLMVFAKGPRACVGRHLAMAEATIGVASFVRRFDFEMYQTNRSAFAFDRDRLAPRPLKGTKGIRMRVVGAET